MKIIKIPAFMSKKKREEILLHEQFSEGFIKGYEQGKKDKYREITSQYLILTVQDIKDIKAEAARNLVRELCIYLAMDNMYYKEQIYEIAEKILRENR